MGRTRRIALPFAVAALAIVAVADVASAHEINSARFAAPVPLPLLYLGAGATVAATALLSARLVGPTDASGSATSLADVDPATARGARGVVRLAGLLLVVAVLAAGLRGRQVAAENLATLAFWPLWVDGLALLAALVGSPWRLLSPWRTIYGALCRIEGERIALFGSPPGWLGAWAAVAGFVLLVGVGENLTVVPRSPRATAGLVAAYGLVVVVGALAFGPRWFERADPIEVLLGLVGRVAPVVARRQADGGYEVVLRPPWSGTAAPVRSMAVVGFVVVAVATISFDGFAATATYQDLLVAGGDAVGLAPGPTALVVYAAVLVLFLAAFVGVVRLVARAAGESRRDGDVGQPALVAAFAPTLLPIAVGYEFAHYGPYVVTNAAQAAHVALGAVVVAPPELQPLAGVSLATYWGFEVLAIVAGHVVAVVAAHRVAADRFAPGTARRAHLPLVALMVGYTMVSLWIVSQPVVAG